MQATRLNFPRRASSIAGRLAVFSAVFGTGALLAAPATQPVSPSTLPSAVTLIAPPPLTADMQRRIDLLTRRLSHPSWRVRDQAQDEIAAFGEPAEPYVRQLLTASSDSQSRLGLEGVLAQLAAVRKLGPTVVTLKFKDAPPQDVFAELARQGNIPIQPLRENLWRSRDWPNVTLDLKKRPFWEAMRSACVGAGMRVVFAGGDGETSRLLLTKDSFGEMNCPSSQTGSFLFLATKVARRHALVDAGADADVELEMTFFADPKWRILNHPDQAAIDGVFDDQRKALPHVEPMRMQVYRPESPIWIMRTLVSHVPAGCEKLARLKGAFQISLLEQSEPIEFDNVMKARNVARQIGRQAVQLQEVIKVANSYHAKITFSRNGLSGQEWREAREVESVQLLDEKGQCFIRGSSESAENGDQMTYEITFMTLGEGQGGAGNPVKLVCRMPMEPRDISVPFELTDLPVEK